MVPDYFSRSRDILALLFLYHSMTYQRPVHVQQLYTLPLTLSACMRSPSSQLCILQEHAKWDASSSSSMKQRGNILRVTMCTMADSPWLWRFDRLQGVPHCGQLAGWFLILIGDQLAREVNVAVAVTIKVWCAVFLRPTFVIGVPLHMDSANKGERGRLDTGCNVTSIVAKSI